MNPSSKFWTIKTLQIGVPGHGALQQAIDITLAQWYS